jgi:hypothetical protein
MTDDAEDLVLRLHREEVERIRGRPLEPSQPAFPPSLDLPEGDPNSPLAQEWKLFRQEVGPLLREGHRGRFALVKTGHPITLWDTLRDAAHAARLLYGQEPCLLQEVLPFLRPLRVGYTRLPWISRDYSLTTALTTSVA